MNSTTVYCSLSLYISCLHKINSQDYRHVVIWQDEVEDAHSSEPSQRSMINNTTLDLNCLHAVMSAETRYSRIRLIRHLKGINYKRVTN